MNKKGIRSGAALLAALFLLALTGCGSNMKNASASLNGAGEKEASADGASMEEIAQQYADNENPVAIIEMDEGGCIVMELYKDIAPITVQNFISLANSGFYDGLTFHRIDPSFMIQGGDPDGNGYGGSEQAIIGEFAKNGYANDIAHTKGVISMARPGNDMNGARSQFFIMVEDAPHLDGQYAAFGHVTEGQEIVDQIAADAAPIDNNGSIKAEEQPVITAGRVID